MKKMVTMVIRYENKVLNIVAESAKPPMRHF